VNRSGGGRGTPGAGQPGSGSWTPLLLGALSAAVVSVVVVWFLMPRTPDAFSATGNALAAGNALPAGSHGPSSAARLPVFTYFGSAGPTAPAPRPVPSTPAPETATPTLEPVSPATRQLTPSPIKSERSRTASPGAGPNLPQNLVPSPSSAFVLYATPPPAGPASFPAAVVGRDVDKAYAYSPTIAVEAGRGDSFAVAPVADPGGSSPVPLLLAAALLGALACLSGALFSRRRTRWEPMPAAADRLAGSLPLGTEPVAGSELRQLRRSAEQKTALARSVAELMPSLPDALVWRAEQALADVDVRQVIPDGQPFDANAHHAVGTEPVPRGGRENIIARTIRPGYADGENILVYPKVIVYADEDGRTR
jgi:GrpE